MKPVSQVALIAIYLMPFANPVFGYEVGTHANFSALAVAQWLQGDPDALKRLGLSRREDDVRQQFPNSNGQQRTVFELIQDGSRFEDGLTVADQTRSLNHFFNPLNGLGLTVGNLSFSPSPDWALEDLREVPGQDYSLKDAREYEWAGLTTPDGTRFGNLGALFQTMGHVIHHLQDMAQPQHVRNDAHFVLTNPSLFERLTDRESGAALAQVAAAKPYPSVHSIADPATFATPRHFWINGGKGIAEYTNKGFFSAGTIGSATGDTFPSPAIDPSERALVEIVDIKDLVPGTALSGLLFFFPNVVHDSYLGVDETDGRALTESIFDPELTKVASVLPAYSLNSFDFASSRQLLVPRAIGYSAGFLHYFFRGQMEIAPPPEGVYGIIDTTTCFPAGLCGFGKIKLLLKNTTPNDDMGAGTLRAVAKYHLNTCYHPDLSGEYGGDNFLNPPGSCGRSAEEYIVVSNAIAIDPRNGVGNGPNSGVGRSFDTQARAFTFPNPIPINASDLFLQVVFRGTLGQESDAIAVTTKDIAEPNFIALENMTDYAFVPNQNKYAPDGDPDSDGDLDSAPITFPNLTVAFGSNVATVGPGAIATISSLGGGQHAQLALLMDRGVNDISVTWDHGWTADAWIPDPTPIARGVQEFTMDDTGPYADQYTRTCPVVSSRGVYRQSDYLFFYQEVEEDVVGGRGLKRRELQLRSSISQGQGFGGPSDSRLKSAVVGSGQVQPRAAVASDCQGPTTGIYDFSKMTPLNPAAANHWQINF